jgi:hypothetical protein
MLILKVRSPSSLLETRTLVMSTPSGFSPVASWKVEVLATTRPNDAGATVTARANTVRQRSRVTDRKNNGTCVFEPPVTKGPYLSRGATS